MTTKELDTIAEEFIRSHDGATPAFKGYGGFPATMCTSINNECVHGIPGPKILRDGDIIGLDGGVIFGGLYTDSCITVGVGSVAEDVRTFLGVTKNSLEQACSIVNSGVHVGDISATVQGIVEGGGYNCVNGLTGHGLGTHLHQFPDVPNTGTAGTGPALPAFTLIAIEPITAMGGGDIHQESDGWTITTADGSLSAHFEHTVLVTEKGHEVLV
jgi:methionyl aminopeptidase